MATYTSMFLNLISNAERFCLNFHFTGSRKEATAAVLSHEIQRPTSPQMCASPLVLLWGKKLHLDPKSDLHQFRFYSDPELSSIRGYQRFRFWFRPTFEWKKKNLRGIREPFSTALICFPQNNSKKRQNFNKASLWGLQWKDAQGSTQDPRSSRAQTSSITSHTESRRNKYSKFGGRGNLEVFSNALHRHSSVPACTAWQSTARAFTCWNGEKRLKFHCNSRSWENGDWGMGEEA